MSAERALTAEARLYDHLFTKEDPDEAEEGKDFKDFINPASLQTLKAIKVEPSLACAAPGSVFQFERQGYFCADAQDSAPDRLVFNRTATLRDSWAKIEKKQNAGK